MKTIRNDRRRKTHIRPAKICLAVISIVLIITIVFPMVYILFNSFMSPQELNDYYMQTDNASADYAIMHIIPDKFTLDNFYAAFFESPQMWLRFWKSLFLCAVILILQLTISSLAGFSFAKMKFRGRRALYFALIVLMLLPVQVTIVPSYILFSKLKLLDTWWPLILPSAFTPFGTFMMAQVFRAIPGEIFEAARLDGAGTLRIIREIALPAGKSGLISVIILIFIDAWSMVEQPIAFLTDSSKYPLGVFLAFYNEGSFAVSLTCGLLAMVPGLMLFLNFRDELSEGIEFSRNA